MSSPFFKRLQDNTFSVSLPTVVTKQNKYLVGVFLALFAIAFYLLPNHFPYFEPKLLSLLWIDKAVPFLPHSVWVYVSEYIFFIVVYLSCNNIKNLNKFFYSFLMLQIVSVAIFWLWPTTYPRAQFPLTSDLDLPTYFIFDLLRKTDTPANCCPSLHVSSVYLSSFLFLGDQQPRKFLMFLTWGTAIAFSTLSTKQHYVVDVVSGFAMATFFYWFFHKFVFYTPPPKRR